jgi:hypothetical protein
MLDDRNRSGTTSQPSYEKKSLPTNFCAAPGHGNPFQNAADAPAKREFAKRQGRICRIAFNRLLHVTAKMPPLTFQPELANGRNAEAASRIKKEEKWRARKVVAKNSDSRRDGLVARVGVIDQTGVDRAGSDTLRRIEMTDAFGAFFWIDDEHAVLHPNRNIRALGFTGRTSIAFLGVYFVSHGFLLVKIN